MMDFIDELDKAICPYFICAGTVEGGPIYDYGVTGVIEDFLYAAMDRGEISASFNYCDFACDGEVVQGCMTVTIFRTEFVPEVYTFLYERELKTCE